MPVTLRWPELARRVAAGLRLVDDGWRISEACAPSGSEVKPEQRRVAFRVVNRLSDAQQKPGGRYANPTGSVGRSRALLVRLTGANVDPHAKSIRMGEDRNTAQLGQPNSSRQQILFRASFWPLLSVQALRSQAVSCCFGFASPGRRLDRRLRTSGATAKHPACDNVCLLNPPVRTPAAFAPASIPASAS
jgi:hypothetical protein